jgi:hypothetical protein
MVDNQILSSILSMKSWCPEDIGLGLRFLLDNSALLDKHRST